MANKSATETCREIELIELKLLKLDKSKQEERAELADLLVQIACRACKSLEKIQSKAPEIVNEVAKNRATWPTVANIVKQEGELRLIASGEGIELGASLPVDSLKSQNWIRRAILGFVEEVYLLKAKPASDGRVVTSLDSLDSARWDSVEEAQEYEDLLHYEEEWRRNLPCLSRENDSLSIWTEAIHDVLLISLVHLDREFESNGKRRRLAFNISPLNSRTIARFKRREKQILATPYRNFEKARDEFGEVIWEDYKKEIYESQLQADVEEAVEKIDSEDALLNLESSAVKEVIRETLEGLLVEPCKN